ncbi:hypothetical protein LOTGIDRAFT_189171 [Lottia gigantea]|uniref:NADH dehydrogenase [ubiquinone] 1 alpha subcomplex subunit 13 n=1 Tax=Lottia gigantea TaxID=225164 RepID=V4BZB1_LOTGI|nr:hypothetical protein LOTGIDRAFT_189171 [Lottia gigantea]ESO94479.1 hypothetical protein LOTGIDRAFT_189171 [Lottia gigantea]
MSAKAFKQEMAPKGGFGPIHWAKRTPKPLLSGFVQFGLMGGFMGFWLYMFYKFGFKRVIYEQIELQDAMAAIEPLLEAEKHRMFLIRMRQNRDYENELMKDYPGWKTGTLFGEPVFHNKRERFMTPSLEEYYAHTETRHYNKKKFPKIHFEF